MTPDPLLQEILRKLDSIVARLDKILGEPK